MLAEAWIRYFKVTSPDGPPPITATLIAERPMLNLVDFPSVLEPDHRTAFSGSTLLIAISIVH